MNNSNLYQKSILLGGFIGVLAGTLLGASAGAITTSWSGVLYGLVAGAILGTIIGIATGWLTARVGGTTGGVSTGAYTGMGLGALIGGIAGALIPDAVRIAANTTHTPIMDVLTASKFETAFLICFLASIAGTAVGAWVGGRNLISQDKHPKNIDKIQM
ncbi:MAG: hypothetical protein JNM55_15870 [Anaerolineales bacterium]|nr:hypothetical protein [Anaerolineales bacterium]